MAKISDLGVAKVIKADSRKTMTKAPGTVDFMPPESLARSPVYGPLMDVFSFGGIILHYSTPIIVIITGASCLGNIVSPINTVLFFHCKYSQEFMNS